MNNLLAELDAPEPIRLAAALEAGKKVAPDVTGLLAEDHRTVLGWFRWRNATTDGAVRARLVERICLALRAHMVAEETDFYRAIDGGEASVAQAFAEHADAKGIIERLTAGGVDEATRDELVAVLERDVAMHVADEETRLFPAARRAEIDLYATGRLVAARRARELLRLSSPQAVSSTARNTEEEIPVMHIPQEEAREYFLVGLKNAHATVRQGRTLVAAQVERLESYPQLEQKLKLHLREKDAQLQRLEELLRNYGESPSVVKDAAMTIAAGAAGIASATAADEVVKNTFATLAQAKYEAAAFETLLVFGQAAGEAGALRPLQLCLSESRGVAAFVEENLRGTAVRFLQLRSEGRQAKR
jgi:ferritin-like metal-binding protein YciE